MLTSIKIYTSITLLFNIILIYHLKQPSRGNWNLLIFKGLKMQTSKSSYKRLQTYCDDFFSSSETTQPLNASIPFAILLL